MNELQQKLARRKLLNGEAGATQNPSNPPSDNFLSTLISPVKDEESNNSAVDPKQAMRSNLKDLTARPSLSASASSSANELQAKLLRRRVANGEAGAGEGSAETVPFSPAVVEEKGAGEREGRESDAQKRETENEREAEERERVSDQIAPNSEERGEEESEREGKSQEEEPKGEGGEASADPTHSNDVSAEQISAVVEGERGEGREQSGVEGGVGEGEVGEGGEEGEETLKEDKEPEREEIVASKAPSISLPTHDIHPTETEENVSFPPPSPPPSEGQKEEENDEGTKEEQEKEELPLLPSTSLPISNPSPVSPPLSSPPSSSNSVSFTEKPDSTQKEGESVGQVGKKGESPLLHPLSPSISTPAPLAPQPSAPSLSPILLRSASATTPTPLPPSASPPSSRSLSSIPSSSLPLSLNPSTSLSPSPSAPLVPSSRWYPGKYLYEGTLWKGRGQAEKPSLSMDRESARTHYQAFLRGEQEGAAGASGAEAGVSGSGSGKGGEGRGGRVFSSSSSSTALSYEDILVQNVSLKTENKKLLSLLETLRRELEKRDRALEAYEREGGTGVGAESEGEGKEREEEAEKREKGESLPSLSTAGQGDGEREGEGGREEAAPVDPLDPLSELPLPRRPRRVFSSPLSPTEGEESLPSSLLLTSKDIGEEEEEGGLFDEEGGGVERRRVSPRALPPTGGARRALPRNHNNTNRPSLSLEDIDQLLGGAGVGGLGAGGRADGGGGEGAEGERAGERRDSKAYLDSLLLSSSSSSPPKGGKGRVGALPLSSFSQSDLVRSSGMTGGREGLGAGAGGGDEGREKRREEINFLLTPHGNNSSSNSLFSPARDNNSSTEGGGEGGCVQEGDMGKELSYEEFSGKLASCPSLLDLVRKFLLSVLGPAGDYLPPPKNKKVDYIFYGPTHLPTRCSDFFSLFSSLLPSQPAFQSLGEEALLCARDWLEEYVMERVGEKAWKQRQGIEEDRVVERRMEVLSFLTPQALDIKPELLNATLLSLATDELRKVNAYQSPGEKVQCIVKCVTIIFRSLSLARLSTAEDNNNSDKERDSTPAGADDFLPLFIWVVLKSRIPGLYSNCEYIHTYLNPARLMGKPGYCLINLRSAIEFVMYMDNSTVNMEPEEFDRLVRLGEEEYEMKRKRWKG